MINFKEKKIGVSLDRMQEIKSFQVWFTTPLGLLKDLDEAIKICEEHDIDPNLGIRLLPVAIGVDVFEQFS